MIAASHVRFRRIVLLQKHYKSWFAPGGKTNPMMGLKRSLSPDVLWLS